MVDSVLIQNLLFPFVLVNISSMHFLYLSFTIGSFVIKRRASRIKTFRTGIIFFAFYWTEKRQKSTPILQANNCGRLLLHPKGIIKRPKMSKSRLVLIF